MTTALPSPAGFPSLIGPLMLALHLCCAPTRIGCAATPGNQRNDRGNRQRGSRAGRRYGVQDQGHAGQRAQQHRGDGRGPTARSRSGASHDGAVGGDTGDGQREHGGRQVRDRELRAVAFWAPIVMPRRTMSAYRYPLVTGSPLAAAKTIDALSRSAWSEVVTVSRSPRC